MEKIVLLVLMALCLVHADLAKHSKEGRPVDHVKVRAGGPLVGRAWHGAPSYGRRGQEALYQPAWGHAVPAAHSADSRRDEQELAALIVKQLSEETDSPAIPPVAVSSQNELASDDAMLPNASEVEPTPEPEDPSAMTEEQLESIMASLGELLIQLARESYKYKVLSDREVEISSDRPKLAAMVELAKSIDIMIDVLGASLPTSIQQCLDLVTPFPVELITPTRRVALLGQLVVTLSRSQNLAELDELVHLDGMENMAPVIREMKDLIVEMGPSIEPSVPAQVELVPEEPVSKRTPINTAIHQLLDVDVDEY